VSFHSCSFGIFIGWCSYSQWAKCIDKCQGRYNRVSRRNCCSRLDVVDQERVVRISMHVAVPVACVFHDPLVTTEPYHAQSVLSAPNNVFVVVTNNAAENVLPHLTMTFLLISKRHLIFWTCFLEQEVAYGGLMREFIFSARTRTHSNVLAHIYKRCFL
jgi:hypothetical protein